MKMTKIPLLLKLFLLYIVLNNCPGPKHHLREYILPVNRPPRLRVLHISTASSYGAAAAAPALWNDDSAGQNNRFSRMARWQVCRTIKPARFCHSLHNRDISILYWPRSLSRPDRATGGASDSLKTIRSKRRVTVAAWVTRRWVASLTDADTDNWLQPKGFPGPGCFDFDFGVRCFGRWQQLHVHCA